MTTKKKRSKLFATTILIMILLILTAGARLVLDDASNKRQYEITRAIYTEKLASMKRLQQEGIRVAAVRKAEEARVEEERLAEIAKAQADRKQRLEAERLKRNEEKKKQPVLASRSNEYKGQWQEFQATAYTSYCTGCSGITKTGVNLRKSIYHEGRRVIAVDPSLIPLGSTVEVELADGTVFEATAQDIGSAIKGKIIDVSHETKKEAYTFGRQTIKLRITSKPPRD